MNPRTRRTVWNLSLVAAALALVAVVWLTRGAPTTDELAAREGRLLPAYREADVERLALTERGAPSVVLERSLDGADESGVEWRLTAPVEHSVEQSAVDDYLVSLDFASWERVLAPEDADPARLGLAEPALVAVVGDASGRDLRIALGAEAPSPPGARYVEVSGDGLAAPRFGVVSARVAAELSRGLSAFRSRDLVPYLSNELSRLVLGGAGGERVFRQTTLGDWRVEQGGVEVRVARRPFDELLVALARLEAQQFVDDSVAEAAQAAPGAETVTLTLVPRQSALPEAILRVGGDCPGAPRSVVARRLAPAPLSACVQRTVLPAMVRAAREFADARLFSMRQDEVEEWRLAVGETRLALARAGTGWTMQRPVSGAVDAEAGNQQLSAFLSAEGERTSLAATDAGLAAPAGTLELRSVAPTEETVRVERLRFTAPDARGERLVLREADGVVLRLGPGQASLLEADASLVRSRTLLDLPAGAVTALRVKGPLGAFALAKGSEPSEGTEAPLVLAEPPGYAADADVVADWARLVAGLTAVRWASETEHDEHGLARPALEVAFATRDAAGIAKEHRLRVGAPTRGGSFAALDGVPGVFVLPSATLRALEQAPLQRAGFGFDPRELVSLTLSAGARRVTLTADGARLDVHPAGALSPAAAAALVDALGALHAEGVVAMGKGSLAATGLAKPRLQVEARLRGGSRVAYVVGAADTWRGANILFARLEGVDAVFALPRGPLRDAEDALDVR